MGKFGRSDRRIRRSKFETLRKRQQHSHFTDRHRIFPRTAPFVVVVTVVVAATLPPLSLLLPLLFRSSRKVSWLLRRADCCQQA